VERTSASAARRRPAASALIVAVFLAGLALSAASAVVTYRVQRQHAQQLMDRYAADVSQAVTDETARYIDSLAYMAAAIGSDSDFTAYDFAAVTSPLTREQLPGAKAVNLAVPTTNDQMAAVETYWRGRGSIGLTLKPVGPGSDHILTVLNRTFDGPPEALGRDLTQAPEPVQALRAAHDTGKVTASRTYVLLTDRALPKHQQQLSFILAAPVISGTGNPDAGRFRGWVQLSMRGADFVAETLRHQSRGAVAVTLTDISLPDQPKIVASTAEVPVPPGPLDRRLTIRVAQRDWQLHLQPGPTLLTATDRHLPFLTLAAGVVVTLLLSTLTAVLVGSRARALAEVDQATTALRIDIQQRKQTEARLRERERQLEHIAFHDTLTGLANRALFYNRTEHAIAAADRIHGPLAVLFVDLDRFKPVNDQLGHAAGDAVLVEVANRLRRCARASDTIGRLGGDEFAILAEHMIHPQDAETIADRIIHAVATPIDLNGTSVTISASVGVAVRQPHHRKADDLLLDADHAMYVAKSAGHGQYSLAPNT
jgi:diguanylate cyclase (GGDEF)-like protein